MQRRFYPSPAGRLKRPARPSTSAIEPRWEFGSQASVDWVAIVTDATPVPTAKARPATTSVASRPAMIRLPGVGHRVPTGFVDRNLLLVVEAISDVGERVPARSGPKLPAEAGLGGSNEGNYAGLPGRLFAKRLESAAGQRPAAFWHDARVAEDSRLQADAPDTATWTYARGSVAKVRVRLIYRRFYKSVADVKGWQGNDVVVFDETHTVAGGK